MILRQSLSGAMKPVPLSVTTGLAPIMSSSPFITLLLLLPLLRQLPLRQLPPNGTGVPLLVTVVTMTPLFILVPPTGLLQTVVVLTAPQLVLAILFSYML